MIKGKDIYEVLAAVVPLYVAMILAYGSVRWWKIFTPDQCSGINRFVSMFAIPFLSFHFISANNPYAMNMKFIAADSLQKVVILGALFLWNTFTTKYGSLDWTITFFSLSTLPNTLIMGVPLLSAMYGDFTSTLMIQIVVLQSVIWYTLLLFLYEYRGAKHLISEKFHENAGSITSLRVDSDVGSLSTREPLQADSEIGEDGKFHVVVRRSASSSFDKSLNGVDTYSVQSYREPTQRTSSFNQTGLYTKYASPASYVNLRHAGNSEAVDVPNETAASKGVHELIDTSSGPEASGKRELEIEEGINYCPLGGCRKEVNIEEEDANKKQQMPPASVMTRLILVMVWRKLIRNPNTYASLLGLAWSLISFGWNIKMPSIINGCISIMSNAGLGMAMFSLGLFMALQPKIIACGKALAAISLAIRFLVGPAVVAATSTAIGIRGVLLQVTIIQAALPQAIVSFVFAKEYNLHADILGTAVIFGMMAALPVTILYFVLLGL
ncbi:auxin efflux carrier component 2-like [Gastrolobium bilobum]|uniref:auxin efflux carrier component 2-like n=1 Tax=Gastrolobium bilobum TaxID=150636 RepID=UPI002AB2D97C|nr:auxin efflux carrier component 2-like [Gastrolobium bilobum]